MNLHRWTLSFTLMIFCLPAWPKTWEVSLTQVKESATGVVNLYEGRFHPPLQIRGLMVNSINYNRPIPLGSGRHGAFTPERYSLFSENGDLSGQIIRLSLEKFPTLEVTDFHLGAGWTLEPVGEGALQIYSHGNVLIEGLINCSGEA